MQKLSRLNPLLLLLLVVCLLASCAVAQESGRKVTYKVEPVYPDVAKRLDISGSVRLAITVSPQGTVREIKVMGGHPLLVNAAVTAVHWWKYTPGSETVETVVADFTGRN